MEEAILDISLHKLKGKLQYLWSEYDFHLVFFTRDYGRYYKGCLMGLENKECRIVFRRDSNSIKDVFVGYIGTKYSPFQISSMGYQLKDGWYPIRSLSFWLSGIDYEFGDNIDSYLQDFSEYLKLNMDSLIELFKNPEKIDENIKSYRDSLKDNQLTIEKIREERARLEFLGMDSSLEAAIKSLRGGKQ